MIEIIWYRKIIEQRWGGEHWYNDMEQYEILYRDGYNEMLCILDNDYGDCMSWYTSATWGSKEIQKIENYWEIHYKPIKPIILDSIDDFIIVDEDWGCGYYPTWYANIQERWIEYFKPTIRLKQKRQVYIFRWSSWKGKSYIWRKIGRNVYETDSCNELPDIISEEIIILWNKYNFSIEDIKQKIMGKYDLIIVNFE